MKMLTINYDGHDEAAHPTMGALLRFKEDCGKDVTEVSTMEDSLRYCYHCWCAQKERRGEKVDVDFRYWADGVDQASYIAWTQALTELAESKKK